MISGQNSNLAAIIIGALALGVSVYNFITIFKFNKTRKTFFAGRTGADMEFAVNILQEKFQNLRQEHLVLEQAVSLLQHDFGFTIQKIGLVRFNPFGDGGGNFSFCLAILDAHDTGVVLTSMHGRQQNRIYAKKIVHGAGEAALTEEERQAITEAGQNHQINKTERKPTSNIINQ